MSGGGTSALEVDFRHADSDPNDNGIFPYFEVRDNGVGDIALSHVTVRYWYTREGAQSEIWTCFWAQVGCNNVQASIVAMSSPRSGADHYLQLSFLTGAGTLSAGGTTGDVQTRINKIDWSNYTEGNDYSYLASAVSSPNVPNARMTAYVDGTLAWGIEP